MIITVDQLHVLCKHFLLYAVIARRMNMSTQMIRMTKYRCITRAFLELLVYETSVSKEHTGLLNPSPSLKLGPVLQKEDLDLHKGEILSQSLHFSLMDKTLYIKTRIYTCPNSKLCR